MSGSTSTRPYLIRALYEWCTDNGMTPYVAVRVDDSVRVPREHVKDGEIVLNISMDATSALKLGNEYIEFKARFAGVARDILVPVGRVIAIYARESGQGMAFPPEDVATLAAPAMAQLADKVDAPAAATDSVGMAERTTTATGPSLLTPVEGGAPQAPEPPKPGGGAGRPALKRIK